MARLGKQAGLNVQNLQSDIYLIYGLLGVYLAHDCRDSYPSAQDATTGIACASSPSMCDCQEIVCRRLMASMNMKLMCQLLAPRCGCGASWLAARGGDVSQADEL